MQAINNRIRCREGAMGMRMELIDRRWNVNAPFELRIGEKCVTVRQPVIPTDIRCNEWYWTWLDGRSVVLQCPILRRDNVLEWRILIDGILLCVGQLVSGLWQMGRTWQCSQAEFPRKICQGRNCDRALYDESGRRLAAWSKRCCGLDAVIRPRMASCVVIVIVAIIVESYCD